MWIPIKTYSTTPPRAKSRDESNEPNYAMIKQCHATVSISNDGLIRFNKFVSRFPVHPCN